MKKDEQLLHILTHFQGLDQGPQSESQICHYLTDRKFTKTMFAVLRKENVFVKIETRAEGDPVRFRFAGIPSQYKIEKIVDDYREQDNALKRFKNKENAKVGDKMVRVTKENINLFKKEKMGKIRDTTLVKYKQLVEELYNKTDKKWITSEALHEIINRLKCMKQVQGIMFKTGVLKRNKREYMWNTDFFPSLDLATYLLKYTNASVQTKPFAETYFCTVTKNTIDPSMPFKEVNTTSTMSSVSAHSVFEENNETTNTTQPAKALVTKTTETSNKVTMNADVKMDTDMVDLDMELSIELIKRGRKTEALALLKNGVL